MRYTLEVAALLYASTNCVAGIYAIVAMLCTTWPMELDQHVLQRSCNLGNGTSNRLLNESQIVIPMLLSVVRDRRVCGNGNREIVLCYRSFHVPTFTVVLLAQVQLQA